MRIGAHIWIGKGLVSAAETASRLGCNCFQIFVQNPRSWKRTKREDAEVMNFIREVKRQNLSPVVAHMPYILNLASPDKKIVKMSQNLLEYEMMECERLKIGYYVIHPGSHKGAGVEAGIKILTESLKPFINSEVKILLENTAGQGNTVGGRWEEFEYIFERYGKKIGLCLDTAHSFQAGYDIREKDMLYEMIDTIKKVSYPGSIFIIHSNDSPSPRGSHLDRHQHIGKGYLGEETFELLIRDEYLGTLPFIIETPKEDIEMDRRNLDILREIGKRYKRI